MVRITSMALALALLMLVGCQDDTAPGPTTQDFNKARQEAASKLDRGEKKAPARPPQPKPEPEQPTFAAQEAGYHYDANNKRDPFRSFRWEQLKLEISDAEARGPLEQFDVSQLTVVGVVWNDNNARALVLDPSGMSYIVGKGTRIGKNDGRVTKIDDNLVVVRETYEDYLGEKTTKDVEMRIRPTEGG
jgi:type IV pilus assembly protein PilP